mgnify:CR=1 FL=1|tara:strand:+ start:239 stop:448 length:210 start_codon:yes stop_codon:yes gene_type:complete
MKEKVFNSSNALMQMDWLTLAPMTMNRWWGKVSRHEHASLMTNGYIITLPYGKVWHVKITPRGKARLEQ